MEETGLPELFGGLLAACRVALEVEVGLDWANNRHALDHFHKIEDSAITRAEDMDVGAAVGLLEVKCESEFLWFAVPIDLGPLIARHRA